MDRPTKEVTLSESGVRVILYDYLSTGELRQIQRGLLKDQKYNVNKKDEEVTTVTDLEFSTLLDQQDLALKLLIKEAFTKDGAAITDPYEYIMGLRPSDTEVLFEKVTATLNASGLDAERKKK